MKLEDILQLNITILTQMFNHFRNHIKLEDSEILIALQDSKNIIHECIKTISTREGFYESNDRPEYLHALEITGEAIQFTKNIFEASINEESQEEKDRAWRCSENALRLIEICILIAEGRDYSKDELQFRSKYIGEIDK